MTTNFYKSLILEALKAKATNLHNRFLEQLQSKCVSFVKVKDTFGSANKKEWIRQYTADCAENNTVQVTLTNTNKYPDQWNISCYCDYKMGNAVMTQTFCDYLLTILDQYDTDRSYDLLTNIANICNRDETIENEQAKSHLVDSLIVRYKAKVIKDQIVVSLGFYRISLIKQPTEWEVRVELLDQNFGDVKLTENSLPIILKCISNLAFQYPQQALSKLYK